MFKAVRRFVRAVLYTFIGDLGKWSEVWEANPAYIDATYDDIEAEEKDSIKTITDAASALAVLRAQKANRLESLSKEIEKLEQNKVGAQQRGAALAKQLQTQGVSVEDIKKNPEIARCNASFKDFTSTLQAKREEAEAIDKELRTADEKISTIKTQLERKYAGLRRIKEERHETKADMETAKQENAVAQALQGITETNTAEARQRMQDMRKRMRASADLNTELAGMQSGKAEEEFAQYAKDAEANDEFFQLIGVAKKEETAVAASEEKVKIPEN